MQTPNSTHSVEMEKADRRTKTKARKAYQSQREARHRCREVVDRVGDFLDFLEELEQGFRLLKAKHKKDGTCIAAKSPWNAISTWIGQRDWEERLTSLWREFEAAVSSVLGDVQFGAGLTKSLNDSTRSVKHPVVTYEQQVYKILLQEIAFLKFVRVSIAEAPSDANNQGVLEGLILRLRRREMYLHASLADVGSIQGMP
jgi:hypothetical protein